MKVSTDACIQGAWTPILPRVKRVLDIGTGTGLLSLMLAQRNAAIRVDAIELDEAAARQAHENVSASPWADRIEVLQGDVRSYPFAGQYDMIICNPPFFSNSLQSADTSRNNARHDITLSQQDTLLVLERLLKNDGYAAVQFPAIEHENWERSLKINDWHIFNKLFIIPIAGKLPNRILSLCNRHNPTNIERAELLIRMSYNNYSPAFNTLLSPFYL